MYNYIGNNIEESNWSPVMGKPTSGQIVYGFDEWDKEERRVRYRKDSNRFFDEPYTGAIYPKDRMHKWRPIEVLAEVNK